MADKTYVLLDDVIAHIASCERSDMLPVECSAITLIKNLPAAAVVPVRYGQWIVSATDVHFDSRCSACKESFYSPIRGAYIVHFAKYCPNCGAKMEGIIYE